MTDKNVEEPGFGADERAAVKQYVRDHIAQPISVAELAAVLDMSESCFARLFKEASGQTPHQFVLEQRIDVAMELLRTNAKESIAAVAIRTGFSDQAHLTRTFRKIAGKTPGEFVEMQQDCSRRRSTAS